MRIHSHGLSSKGMPIRVKTDFIVIHCSATKPTMDIGFKEINQWHLQKGWGNGVLGCGYHEIIRRDGTVEEGRDPDVVGAHTQGYNSRSIGICMVGGIDSLGHADDNFTVEQFDTLKDRVLYYLDVYPNAEVLGHRDLSPDLNKDGYITQNEWVKDCPCFSVAEFTATFM